jgi:hypothetical protein
MTVKRICIGEIQLYDMVKLNADMVSYSGDIVKVPMNATTVNNMYLEGPWFYKALAVLRSAVKGQGAAVAAFPAAAIERCPSWRCYLQRSSGDVRRVRVASVSWLDGILVRSGTAW